jgi:hypothetical protein
MPRGRDVEMPSTGWGRDLVRMARRDAAKLIMREGTRGDRDPSQDCLGVKETEEEAGPNLLKTLVDRSSWCLNRGLNIEITKA